MNSAGSSESMTLFSKAQVWGRSKDGPTIWAFNCSCEPAVGDGMSKIAFDLTRIFEKFAIDNPMEYLMVHMVTVLLLWHGQ